VKIRLWHWWVVVALNAGTVVYTAAMGEMVGVVVFLLLTVGYSWLVGFAFGDDTFHRDISAQVEKWT
jgi:hypothetical protein